MRKIILAWLLLTLVNGNVFSQQEGKGPEKYIFIKHSREENIEKIKEVLSLSHPIALPPSVRSELERFVAENGMPVKSIKKLELFYRPFFNQDLSDDFKRQLLSYMLTDLKLRTISAKVLYHIRDVYIDSPKIENK